MFLFDQLEKLYFVFIIWEMEQRQNSGIASVFDEPF